MTTDITFQGPGLTPHLKKSLSCMLEDAISRVVAEFSNLGSARLFEKITFSVTVLDQPTPECSASTIRVTTPPGHADVLLVSPTVHPDRTPDGFSRSQVEAVAAEDEVGAVASRAVPGLRHVVDGAIDLAEPKGPGGDQRVARDLMDGIGRPVDRQDEAEPGPRGGLREGRGRHGTGHLEVGPSHRGRQEL